MTLFLVQCSKILDEQPRSIYEPGFFKTEKGVKGGLTSMYAHLRYIYGQAYYYNVFSQVPMKQHMLRVQTKTLKIMTFQVQDQLLHSAAVPMFYGQLHSLISILPVVLLKMLPQ